MPRPMVWPMRALMAYIATMPLDTVRRDEVGHACMACSRGGSVKRLILRTVVPVLTKEGLVAR